MLDLKPIRDEFAVLNAQAETLLAKAVSEKRDLTSDENAEKDKTFARMSEIKNVLENSAKLAEYAFASKQNVELPSEPAGREEKEAVEIKVGKTYDRRPVSDRKEFGRAVTAWMRTGEMERRFSTITGSTQSAIMMPSDVAGPLVPSAMNVFREALEVSGLQPWKTESTRDMKLPIFTASVNSTDYGIVNPTSTSEVEDESALTESIVSQTKTYHSGNFWFENRDLEALDFDLLEASIPAMAYQKELAIERDGVTTIAGTSGLTTVATSTVSGFTYGNLVSLDMALPKRYRPLRVIVLSTQAYTAANNLVTSTGYPILNALDPQNVKLKCFNGTPVIYSDYLSNFGANNVVGFVFSWVGARFRDAGQGDILQRFTQTANRQGQTGADYQSYNAFSFTNNAVALLQCPAS
jgi:HK97 family phage major capsid protein